MASPFLWPSPRAPAHPLPDSLLPAQLPPCTRVSAALPPPPRSPAPRGGQETLEKHREARGRRPSPRTPAGHLGDGPGHGDDTRLPARHMQCGHAAVCGSGLGHPELFAEPFPLLPPGPPSPGPPAAPRALTTLRPPVLLGSRGRGPRLIFSCEEVPLRTVRPARTSRRDCQ